MSWHIASKREHHRISDYLSARECKCVSFSARFRAMLDEERNDEKCVVFVDHTSKNGRIRDAVLVTRHGLILPAFEDSAAESEASLEAVDNGKGSIPHLRELFVEYAHIIHSIMGTLPDVAIMEALFPFPPSDRIEYFLFSLSAAQLKKNGNPVPNGLVVRRATPEDAARILPLQKEYELEEVYIDPVRFNERLCMKNLKSTLANEIVFVTESNGRIIAKAGTNARGYRYDQIGGVFTVREERGKGIGQLTMRSLLGHIFKERKKASLFVKKSNTAAISLYRNLGFEFIDDFRISYYFDRV